MITTSELLEEQFPFFEKELIAELLDTGIPQNIASGDPIIKNGQYFKSFPLILDGNVRVSRRDDEGRELLLYFLAAGDTCSMALTCCMERQQSTICAKAESDTLLIAVPVEYLDKWMIRYPSWRNFMMSAFRKRFNELLDTIDAVAFLELDERLNRFFYSRFKATGETRFDGTHQDLANHLNTSREVVSRLLKQMENKGLVSLARNDIDYKNIIALFE